jgi:hypothetical protein
MNSGELIERAVRRLKPDPTPEELTALRTSLAVLVSEAARRLVAKAFEDGDRRRLESLRREYTLTAADGEADITTLLTEAEGLYPDALAEAEVRDSEGRRFEWQRDRGGVELMAREDFPVVGREGSTLHFGGADGETETYSGGVTVFAYGVTYSNGVVGIPEVLEPALVDALVDLVQGARAEEVMT